MAEAKDRTAFVRAVAEKLGMQPPETVEQVHVLLDEVDRRIAARDADRARAAAGKAADDLYAAAWGSRRPADATAGLEGDRLYAQAWGTGEVA